MRLVALLALLVSTGDTPEQTFDEVRKAVTSKDWGALYDLISPTDRKEVEGDWARQREILNSAEGAEQLKFMARMLGVKEEDLKTMSARDFMVKMIGMMVEKDPKSFDREFAKFRDGAISEKKVEGDYCVLKVKAGGEEVEAELEREGGKWYMSMAKQRREANQRNASATLKTFASAQADFRSNDRDDNKVNDFWVKDVSGLYGLEAGGVELRLIEKAAAQADRTAGKGSYKSLTEETPKAGYHYAAIKRYRESGKAVTYDDGKGRNFSRFGFVAFPAEYPRSARMTFIISEDNTIYSKDTGGKPVEEYPEDPRKEGWKLLD